MKRNALDPVQWCEAHEGLVHEVYPVKRPGTPHWIFVCQQCLKTLKDVELLEFIERGDQPHKHYHQLPAELVADNSTLPSSRDKFEINLKSSEAAILRALGYTVTKLCQTSKNQNASGTK